MLTKCLNLARKSLMLNLKQKKWPLIRLRPNPKELTILIKTWTPKNKQRNVKKDLTPSMVFGTMTTVPSLIVMVPPFQTSNLKLQKRQRFTTITRNRRRPIATQLKIVSKTTPAASERLLRPEKLSLEKNIWMKLTSSMVSFTPKMENWLIQATMWRWNKRSIISKNLLKRNQKTMRTTWLRARPEPKKSKEQKLNKKKMRERNKSKSESTLKKLDKLN